jgi:hypothetical protein
VESVVPVLSVVSAVSVLSVATVMIVGSVVLVLSSRRVNPIATPQRIRSQRISVMHWITWISNRKFDIKSRPSSHLLARPFFTP